MSYIDQNIVFVVPQLEGWVEITQSNRINQPPTLKLNNRRPSTNSEKVDIQKFDTTAFDGFWKFKEFNYPRFISFSWDYLSSPETIGYEDPGFVSCSSIYQSLFLLLGNSSWLVELENVEAINDNIRKNQNKDRNMYVHYYNRVKKALRREV